MSYHATGSVSDSECDHVTYEREYEIQPLSPHRRRGRKTAIPIKTTFNLDIPQPSQPESIPPPSPPRVRASSSSVSSRVPAQIPSISTCPVRLRIIGHEIEKVVLSPRTFDHIRRKTRHQVTFIIEVADGEDLHSVRRNHLHFKKLHSMLRKKYPRSTMPQHIPSMKSRRFDTEYVEGKMLSLHNYLQRLIQVPEIANSSLFHRFLEDHPLSDGSDEDEAVTASFTVLQSFPESTVIIKNGQGFQLNLEVTQPGSIVTWSFYTRFHDIAFCTKFNGAEITPYTREESQNEVIRGLYTCSERGNFTLLWDNSYSWRRAKRLSYRAEILDPAIVTAASKTKTKDPSAASVESVSSQRQRKSSASKRLQELPFKVVSKGISSTKKLAKFTTKPGRMVHSTISKLYHRTPSVQAGEHKTGYMIFLRERKLGRNRWYKKWFLLDVDKGVLHYFSQKADSGRPQRTLVLSRRNTSLSIIGRYYAAPTPYCMVINAGRRSWKICALNGEDYDEWRESISRAIFIAQWSKQVSESDVHTTEDELPLVDSGDKINSGEEEDDDEEDDDDEDYDEATESVDQSLEELSQSSRVQNQEDPINSCIGFEIPHSGSPVQARVVFVCIFNLIFVMFRYSNYWFIAFVLCCINGFTVSRIAEYWSSIKSTKPKSD